MRAYLVMRSQEIISLELSNLQRECKGLRRFGQLVIVILDMLIDY